MSLQHICFTDAEATEYRDAKLHDHPKLLDVFGENALNILQRIALSFFLMAVVFSCNVITSNNLHFGSALAIPVGLTLFAMFFIALYFWNVVDQWNEYVYMVNDDLREATTHELIRLASFSDRYPEIGKVIHGWLADGRTIRNRDVEAIQRWFYELDLGHKHTAAMSKLRIDIPSMERS